MANYEELQLFNADEFVGRMAPGLPDDIVRRAQRAARAHLFKKARCDRVIGRPDDDEEIYFNAENNTWVHWKGAMCSSVTADEVALTGARKYMSDTLGVGYFDFTLELKAIADEVRQEYEVRYPVVANTVMLEPGW